MSLPSIGNNYLDDVTEGSPNRAPGKPPHLSQPVRHSGGPNQRDAIEFDHSRSFVDDDAHDAKEWPLLAIAASDLPKKVRRAQCC